jgi:AbrB family looped-hinge helix DNA binding protein
MGTRFKKGIPGGSAGSKAAKGGDARQRVRPLTAPGVTTTLKAKLVSSSITNIMTVTLKPKTEITVPKSIRQKAGIKPGDRFEFRVSGGVIAIIPKVQPGDEYTVERISQIIADARKNPMSPSDLAATDTRVLAYGARQAKKVGIKEGDINRVIHENRSRRSS